MFNRTISNHVIAQSSILKLLPDSRSQFFNLKSAIYNCLTPLNQKQGYKEAKVGVIFWSKDHQKVKGQRGKIRRREYVATLKSRHEFRNRVSQLYNQVAEHKVAQTVIIGDGAHWIGSIPLLQ